MIRFGRLRTDLSTMSLTIEKNNLFFIIKENNVDLLSSTPQASQFIFSSYLLNAETFLRQSLPESERGYQSTLYLKDKICKRSFSEADNQINIIEDSSINALCIPLDIAKKRFQNYNIKVYERFLSILEKELQSLPDQGLLGKLRSLISACDWHEVSIENLASQMNLSVSTLQRRLRDEKSTFHNIKHEERVADAKELLLLTQQPLETIADTLGYSNTSNFTKSFKTTEGCSPQEFRTLNKLKL
jgi:AraC-like DNA-binding protein